MGSVVVSDILTENAYFSRTMFSGGASRQDAAERPYRSSPSSRMPQASPPNAQPPPARHVETAIEEGSEAGNTPTRSPRHSPSSQQTSAPFPVPRSRTSSHGSNTTIKQSFPTQQHLPNPLGGTGPFSQVTPPYDPSFPPSRTPHRNIDFSRPQFQTPISRSMGDVAAAPRRIKVRDLAHIQSFANEEFIQARASPRGTRPGVAEPTPLYEISSMPVEHIIEMVAGLLTKITTTNDRQHKHLHRHIPAPENASSLTQQSSSVLAFHGRNVPTITIMSYLSRIHKYCPTTYEVFLSLLVYFDRMTERVNSAPRSSLESRGSSTAGSDTTPDRTVVPSGDAMSLDESGVPVVTLTTNTTEGEGATTTSHFFVVDSFNIHRLVIAGVTCASKFFSDVFYTNSRYAKVGGLPLAELNHLELQFLLLNDFRLSVPVEELEAYGTMLVEFYAREVIAQRQATNVMDPLYRPDSGMQTPTPP